MMESICRNWMLFGSLVRSDHECSMNTISQKQKFYLLLENMSSLERSQGCSNNKRNVHYHNHKIRHWILSWSILIVAQILFLSLYNSFYYYYPYLRIYYRLNFRFLLLRVWICLSGWCVVYSGFKFTQVSKAFIASVIRAVSSSLNDTKINEILLELICQKTLMA